MLRALRRVRRQRNLMIGIFFLGTVAAFTLIVPILSPYAPNTQALGNRLEAPTLAHLFGTDSLGRDLMTRIAWGGRTSLTVAFVAVFLGGSIGVSIGILAGYLGGIVDRSASAVISVLMSFPALLLALLIASLLEPGPLSLILAIMATNIAIFARIARGEALRLKSEQYVEAAQTLGATTFRVLRRYILANIWPPLIVAATLRLASAVLVEATISYLGFGVPPPSPTWGGTILEGQRVLERATWVPIGAGAVILLTVLGLNLLGDGLRDVLDPRLRGQVREAAPAA